MNGTPILDIKPYLPFTDSHPDASSGWTAEADNSPLNVVIPDSVRTSYPFNPIQWKIIEGILAGDPRPHYQDNPERIYRFEFNTITIKFQVKDKTVFIIK
jgi:hypothetical protein